MNRADFPFLGFGVGLRRPHYSHVIETPTAVDWFEVVSENFMVDGGRPLQVLEKVRERYPIVLHGVSMSIGSTDPLNREYLSRLRSLARRFEPAWIQKCVPYFGTMRGQYIVDRPYVAELGSAQLKWRHHSSPLHILGKENGYAWKIP